MTELKPCPFCGGEAIEDGEWIFCFECGVGYEIENEPERIDAWNRRAKGNERKV